MINSLIINNYTLCLLLRKDLIKIPAVVTKSHQSHCSDKVSICTLSTAEGTKQQP